MEQLDLFEDSYLSLNDILKLVEEINPTGGIDRNGKPIPMGYQIDYYKDLAFIVLYNEKTDNNEKIIDNAVYLKEIGNGLYKIYSIDGEALGRFYEDDSLTGKRLKLLNWFTSEQVFKKEVICNK